MVRLLEEWTPPHPGFCLYSPGRKPPARFTAFLAMARERAAQGGRWPIAAYTYERLRSHARLSIANRSRHMASDGTIPGR